MTQTAAKTKNGVYSQIEQNLRERIVQGVWPVGTRLPSRRDLAKEYGVSPITLDRAVSNLIADGLLRADDRRGTFVSATSVAKTVPHENIVFPTADRVNPPLLPLSSLSAVKTVGVIAPLYVGDKDSVDLGSFWARLLLHSLEYALSQNGIRTQFFNRVSAQSVVSLQDTLQTVSDKRLDALVVIAVNAPPNEVDESLSALDGQKIPVVCITSGPLLRPVSSVFYDQKSAGYQAAQHLIQIGKRDLVYFAPFTAFWVEERLEGVRAAIQHASVSPKPTLRVYPATSQAWAVEKSPVPFGYRAARQAFVDGVFPTNENTGVISVSDGVAFGFLQAAHEAGKKAGQDFALLGFDDHPDARAVGLTTLRPPMEAMGQEAARLLLRALLDGEQASAQIRLLSQLLPRETTHPPEPHPFL